MEDAAYWLENLAGHVHIEQFQIVPRHTSGYMVIVMYRDKEVEDTHEA